MGVGRPSQAEVQQETAAPKTLEKDSKEAKQITMVLNKLDKYSDAAQWVKCYKQMIESGLETQESWDKHYVYHVTKADLKAGQMSDAWFELVDLFLGSTGFGRLNLFRREISLGMHYK